MRSRAGRYVWHVQAIEATPLDRGCLWRGAIEFLKVSLCRGRFLQDQPGRMLRRSANTEFGGWRYRSSLGVATMLIEPVPHAAELAAISLLLSSRQS